MSDFTKLGQVTSSFIKFPKNDLESFHITCLAPIDNEEKKNENYITGCWDMQENIWMRYFYVLVQSSVGDHMKIR